MTITSAFLRHEAIMQLRSGRFRGLAIAYVLLATTPAIGSAMLARRVSYAIGAPSYAAFIDLTQPFLTILFTALIAVDAIARERDENSLPVVSLAPMSAAGYVLRRWLAIVAILIPVTMLPRLIGAAIAGVVTGRMPLVAPFLLAWTITIVPLVLIISAVSMALGTITGRTVLAIVFMTLLPTAILGITNDLLAYAGRRIDVSLFLPQGLEWMIRGWSRPSSSTDAGFTLTPLLQMTVVQYGVPFAFAATILGISVVFLRRSRRDLRPWRERADHPLRGTIRTLNRLRHEYAPDANIERADLAALAACLLLATVATTFLMRRDNTYRALAGERYAAETAASPAPIPLSIVPTAATIDGEVTRNGEVRTRSTITFRNDGATSHAALSFTINARLAIEKIEASSGTARVDRKWERVGVTIDPPLRAGESRTLTFVLRGTPARVGFAFARGATYRQMYEIYRRAESTIDLVDFSQTPLQPFAHETRMQLRASVLAPLPRYSPWTPEANRWQVGEQTFSADLLVPAVPMRIALRLPERFLAADSCGALSEKGSFTSNCTYPMAEYRVLGAPLETMALAPNAALAYIPAHESMARIHGPVLADALKVASDSWPGIDFSQRTVFLERPMAPEERYNDWTWRFHKMRLIAASGRLVTIPEQMMVYLEPMDRGLIAAAVVSNRLRQRRPFVPEEERFFERFFSVMASSRIEGKSASPVAIPFGPRPDTTPILRNESFGEGSARLDKVLAHLDARIGSDRFVAGINDFLSAGREPGTAKQMFDAIGRRAGVNLDRVYSDYFTGSALPKLTFENVTFAKEGGRWVVRGELRNVGTGEAFCPIALLTASGSLRETLRVDTGAAVPFTFTTEHAPRSLQLDPDKVCYRFAAVGLTDVVDYKGQS